MSTGIACCVCNCCYVVISTDVFICSFYFYFALYKRPFIIAIALTAVVVLQYLWKNYTLMKWLRPLEAFHMV